MKIDDNSFVINYDGHATSKSKNFEVVIVRYKEDLSWVPVEFPGEKVIIYNNGEDDIVLPSNVEIVKLPNIGYLGGTYLEHIVRNYDHLADRTLFLQANPYDNNLFRPLITYKYTNKSSCNNLIGKCVTKQLQKESKILDQVDWPNTKWKYLTPDGSNLIEFIHKYIGYYPPKSNIKIAFGAEFAVYKEKILSHSLDYYKELLPMFDSQYPFVDCYLERSWDLLLGNIDMY